MCRALWGWGELDPTFGVGRRTSRDFGSPFGSLGGGSGLKERCGDVLIETGNLRDGESMCLLYLCFEEGALLWVPLDKEFFNVS